MTCISSGFERRRPSRVRMLAIAGVVALHALVWIGAGLRTPVAEQEPHITYAELRFVVPDPVRPPEAVAPQRVTSQQAKPAAQRPRVPAPVPPREAEPPAMAPVQAAPAVELLPADPFAAPAGETERAQAPIDVEALRTAARDYERTRERSPIEKNREQLRREQHRDVTAEAIAKTARADCRNAYSGLSLLAIIPIVVDTVRDKGCKW